MKRPLKYLSVCGLAMIISVLTASAVPYASSVQRSGDTVSFILNQNATGVTVLRNGGNALSLGTSPGEYTFSMAGFTSYQIIVTGNTAKAWTQYVPDGDDRYFYLPRGVSINKHPWSPNFGKVYVSESRGGPTTGGRTTSDGIYILRPDGAAGGFATGGVDWTADGSSGSSPLRSFIGPDDHLYVVNLNQDLAYEFNQDMSVATQLIDADNRKADQYVHSIYVEGTAAQGNRKIYLVNGIPSTTGLNKGLIRYDLGAAETAIGLGTGEHQIGPDYFGIYYGYDVARDPAGDWYMSTYRAVVNSRPPISKFSGTATPPVNTPLWEASSADYYAESIDYNERAGTVAYGHYNTGEVLFYNPADGQFIEKFDAGNRIRDLAFDAAGNLVTVDNSTERARFWSPGGYTVATTSFNGTEASFDVVNLVASAEVNVTATTATANEQGPVNGVYTITRGGDTTQALTVNYTMSGTATSGDDYTALPGTVTILAGSASATVTLVPSDDSVAERTETAILNLGSGAGYSIGTAGTATVSILDNELPEIAVNTLVTNRLLESYAPSKVTIQFIRRGLLTPSVAVNLGSTGSATMGVDFNGASSIVFAANAVTTNLVLTPINDQMYEADELAAVTVLSGTGYTAGTTNTGYALVVNDDPTPGTVLFSDNFDTDSSSLWKVNYADDWDAFVDFAWDYSAVGVPPAPGGGGTKGMRMRAGNTILQLNALSASPLNLNLTGDYRLKFDMWINYNGPMPDGGPGSTQNLDAGVGTSGDVVVWLNNPNSDGVWFSATGDGADGATGGDYNAIIGATIQNDDTGFYAAGVGAANGGLRNNTHPYYSLWGGQPAPAAQLALFDKQTGVANAGNAGMAWHTVVITKQGPVISWVIDGITIATVTNNGTMGNNVFVGYQDLFAGNAMSDEPEMSFGLVDNLKVQTLVAPTAPVVTGIQLVNGGTQVKITFTAGAADSPSAFSVVGASTLGGAFGDVQETITSPSAGQFEALTPVNGASYYYRIFRQ